MALDPRELLHVAQSESEAESFPLEGTRRQRVQRLQIGIFGLATMVVLVALADIIISSAEQNMAGVTEDMPPVTSEDLPPPAPRDPLVEAGVVPNLPVDGATASAQAQPPAQAGNSNAQTPEGAN
jgi:hypothetical protein